MFNDIYIKDIYLSNKEKADKLSDEIMQLIRDEHITLPEVRSLFLYIVGKFEDTPL